MTVQKVIKLQSIKLHEFYLSAVCERTHSDEKVVTIHSKDELGHRRRLRRMQGKNFLERVAMHATELFTGARLAS